MSILNCEKLLCNNEVNIEKSMYFLNRIITHNRHVAYKVFNLCSDSWTPVVTQTDYGLYDGTKYTGTLGLVERGVSEKIQMTFSHTAQ